MALNQPSLHGYAICFQRRLIAFGNLRIFRLVGNEPPTFIDGNENVVVMAVMSNFKSQRIDPAAITDRKMPRWLFTDVEVLVKPVSRRAIDTSLAPFDFYDFVFVY